MVMPDFDTWADLLTDGYKSVKISEALRQAFEQGYQLGLNQGWAYQMDREYKDREGACNNDDR